MTYSSTMVSSQASPSLPPGFRFHPTDEELIVYYLHNQATARPCPVSIIPEVDIYKFDPWQLPEKAEFGETEWYFFSPRDRKYPNGVRPNRATVSGYWKATGVDKAIHSGSRYVGVKKALVFYKGRPPKGLKTNWIMHEYRLSDSQKLAKKPNGSMRLDDWVLCRIYMKKHAAGKVLDQKMEEFDTGIDIKAINDGVDHQEIMMKFPRTCSFSNYLDLDFMETISGPFLRENTYDSGFDCQNSIMGSAETDEFTDSTKFETKNQSHVVNQQVCTNPMGHI